MKNTCCIDNCKIKPYFNFKGQINPIYCNSHKSYNMINIMSRKCIIKDCNKPAYFNMIGTSIKLYCNKHKLPNMIQI